MKEVKHYWPEEIVGTGELVVYAQDYAALKVERDKLAGLLDEVTDDFVVNYLDAELIERIDAALAVLK